MEIENIIKQCCVCKDYSFPDFPDYWIEFNKVIDLMIEAEVVGSNGKTAISHTYCPICYSIEMNHLNFYRVSRRYLNEILS